MQRLPEWLTADIDDIQSHVDDFLVTSATPKKQKSHLRELPQMFLDAGLKIKSKKTVLRR